MERIYIPSARWSANDKLHAGRTKRTDIRWMTPVGIHTAFHADGLRTGNDATTAGTSGVCQRRLLRLLCRISLTWNGNRLGDRQIARPRWTDGFPTRLSGIPDK